MFILSFLDNLLDCVELQSLVLSEGGVTKSVVFNLFDVIRLSSPNRQLPDFEDELLPDVLLASPCSSAAPFDEDEC